MDCIYISPFSGHSKRFTVWPNVHSFTHWQRCQPRKATASSPRAVRVRERELGIKLASFRLPVKPPYLLSHMSPPEGLEVRSAPLRSRRRGWGRWAPHFSTWWTAAKPCLLGISIMCIFFWQDVWDFECRLDQSEVIDRSCQMLLMNRLPVNHSARLNKHIIRAGPGGLCCICTKVHVELYLWVFIY